MMHVKTPPDSFHPSHEKEIIWEEKTFQHGRKRWQSVVDIAEARTASNPTEQDQIWRVSEGVFSPSMLKWFGSGIKEYV